ncbi:MAG TPA: DUF2188 domain-containing protein [Steroidobacteraceae bacterium]|nr:DUF2188 domain-containing protein [Steroidobacteraceae bacterium]
MDEVIEGLRRTLEAHGVPRERAERLAAAQQRDLDQARGEQQHVIPVATGWLVLGTVAFADAEVFAEQADALARARELAAAASGEVVLHDASGNTRTIGSGTDAPGD